MLECDVQIFVCKHCGRYFIPNRKNERYCEEHRIEGANATKQKNLKNDRCRILRKRIYDMLSVRLTRCVDSGAHNSSHKIARQNLDKFTREAERWSAMVNTGQLSEREYYGWLCTQRERYGRYKNRSTWTENKILLYLPKFLETLSPFSATKRANPPPSSLSLSPIRWGAIERNQSGTERDKSGTTHIYFTVRYKRVRQI